nr:hypothetical protein Iba_scaffold96267CG0010 [Ipomoea batatas]GME17365.1 hypothetical protein Iba_scaffold18631CG0060 [Ipomoea batatas]GME21163.1 hypothetical protein Iba_scaffold27010CG0010 [Ipomoea batatas]GME21164.1 hypothetical protein Iba_scaffold27011CG0010 [Ipomoea batatas]
MVFLFIFFFPLPPLLFSITTGMIAETAKTKKKKIEEDCSDGEAMRDSESAGDEAGFDSVNSDASYGVVLVETRLDAESMGRNGE